MGDFKRSPSKVWWASESVEWREVSGSPGSQDSGFSDSETSPPLDPRNKPTETSPKLDSPKISNDIFKESPEQKPQNLSANFKEKITPQKTQFNPQSSPRKSRFTKNSPIVSRNLFNARQATHLYSKDTTKNTTQSSIGSKITYSDDHSCMLDESYETPESSTSLPVSTCYKEQFLLNKSAPAILGDEEETSFHGNNSLSSDCESELECLFNGHAESPKFTSTPKALNRMRHLRDPVPVKLNFKIHQEKRVPPISIELINSEDLKEWFQELRRHYDQECMTTLQCKSIASELHQKVSQRAAYITANLRNILFHFHCIETEYRKLNSETRHVGPLAQSLAGNIVDFLKTFAEVTSTAIKLYDDLRQARPEDALVRMTQLFNLWQMSYQDILVKEVKQLVEALENPRSELDLRAVITAITSVSLRNENLIDTFTKLDIIPALLILCEKCEGSSLRSLLLRALSTMCCTTSAVRQFEKFSGIQIIADTLEEDSRPEPERSEAVALLAQVTAPWIEDNHCIRGLPDYSRRLVKSLTNFVSTTKCCQNLLLCSAALANLSTMDNKSIKYMLHLETVKILLEASMKRGPRISVYLMEQLATLMANASAFEAARKQLVTTHAAASLLRFLKVHSTGEEVEKRLQQKSIIALSRLCGEHEAAVQVVNLGGVEKLVKMCREKNERFDSDAVLVATLATLRKIADTCGNQVISTEDVQELVEPKLLDSFLAYSTQSESYV